MLDPQDSFFRQTAVDHYLAREEYGAVIRISPPWTWAILGVLAAALGVALLASVLGQVEVNVRARGILRPISGVRILTAQVGGVVSHVYAESGQAVKKGSSVLRLESAQVQSQLLEAERQVELLNSEFRVYSERQDRMFKEQEGLLRARLAMLEEESASQEQSLNLFKRKLTASLELEKSGLISPTNVDDVREMLAQSRRRLSSSRQNLAQTRQELSSLRSSRQEELWRRQQEVQTAQNKRDALAFSIQQMLIRAPLEGVVEAMLVKVGDVVQPGQIVGKLVPQKAGFQVVSFLPERDRAFVKAGDDVKLELEQFPYAEFGTLKGRILRISDDLASSFEIREAFGEETKLNGSAYRVEIQVLGASTAQPFKLPLRTGMLMNVRYTLRREHPITLFFEPLRRWLN